VECEYPIGVKSFAASRRAVDASVRAVLLFRRPHLRARNETLARCAPSFLTFVPRSLREAKDAHR
jgi:hypothetical protein